MSAATIKVDILGIHATYQSPDGVTHGGSDFNYSIWFTYDTNKITTGTLLPTNVADQVVPLDSMGATIYRGQESYSINVLTDAANANAVLALNPYGGFGLDQLNHPDWHCSPLGSNNCAGLQYGQTLFIRSTNDPNAPLIDLAHPFDGPLQTTIADWPQHPARTLYGESGDYIYLTGFDYVHNYETAQFSAVPDPVATPEPASIAICGSGLLAVALMLRKRRSSNQK